ncbi:hypothetical protein GCM10027615_31940 [Plantactinospora veratri]
MMTRGPAPTTTGQADPRPLVAPGIGAAAREQRAAALDTWLTGLLAAGLRESAGRGGADPTSVEGVALVAVGGLGRRQCAPCGDLDLVLLHSGVPGMDELAAALWYPIWDARLGLDHSVRTIPEALSVAHDDVKVALGLLDARHVAGERALSARLVEAAADQWRRTAVRALPALREVTATRWQAHGELAFLLEGDLKEAAGGLRDVALLRAIAFAGISDTLRPAVRAAHLRMLDTRDALHTSVGRRVDRLLAQERAAVAGLLGLRQLRRGSVGPTLDSFRRTPTDRPTAPPSRATRCCARSPGTPVPSATPWTTPGGPPTGSAPGGAGAPTAGRCAARSPGTWWNRTANWSSPGPPSGPAPTRACRCGWPPPRPAPDCRSPGPPANGSPRTARRCRRPGRRPPGRH